MAAPGLLQAKTMNKLRGISAKAGNGPWPFALLLLAGTFAGFAPIFVRLTDVGPVSSAFWRVALALPVIALGLSLSRRGGAAPVPLSTRDKRILLLAGVFFALDLGLWHWSISLTTVANASLLPNLNPVFVAAFGFVFLGHRFNRAFLAALALAVGGVALLLSASAQFGGARVTGDLFGIATATMYAAFFLTVSHIRQRVPTLMVMLWVAGLTSLALLPVALLSGEAFLPAGAEGWAALFALALVNQVFAQGLISFSLGHLSAAFSAVAILVQPVVAAIVAWILFNEALGSMEIAGAAAVLSAIAMARKSES